MIRCWRQAWCAPPLQTLSPQADARLSGLPASLLARPEPTLRLDVLKRIAILPPSDAGGALTHPIPRRLGSDRPAEVDAASALIVTRGGRDHDALETSVRGILANRRALPALTKALVG